MFPVLRLLNVKNEVLHAWSASTQQQHPEAFHIKEEEEEEVWTNQEEERPNEQKKTNISRFPCTVVTVKNESYEEKHQLLELHQIKTEENRETEALISSSAQQIKTELHSKDSVGPEPDRNLNPACTFEQNPNKNASDSSDTEASDDNNDEDWQGPLSDSESETKMSHNCENVLSPSQSNVNGEEKCNSVVAGDEGEKLFACSKCDKRFKKRDNLTDHARIHTGEKPFGCDVCEKTFRRKDCLRKHKMIHSGKTAHSCDFCGKGFIEKTDLQAHIRLHTGERPFACDECGRRFHKKSILTVHMRVHSGDKQFKCTVCEKRF